MIFQLRLRARKFISFNNLRGGFIFSAQIVFLRVSSLPTPETNADDDERSIIVMRANELAQALTRIVIAPSSSFVKQSARSLLTREKIFENFFRAAHFLRSDSHLVSATTRLLARSLLVFSTEQLLFDHPPEHQRAGHQQQEGDDHEWNQTTLDEHRSRVTFPQRDPTHDDDDGGE